MRGKDAMTADKTPTQGGMAAMGSMASGNPPSGGAGGAMQSVSGMGGMNNGASPPAGQMGMMGMKMDKMMGPSGADDVGADRHGIRRNWLPTASLIRTSTT